MPVREFESYTQRCSCMACAAAATSRGFQADAPGTASPTDSALAAGLVPQRQVATGTNISLASVTADGVQISDAVLSGAKWATLSLTYSFPDATTDYGYDAYTNAAGTNQFAALNAAQQAAARYSLNLIAEYTNVTFTQSTGAQDAGADIRFAIGGDPRTAYAYYPSSGERGGDIWFNPVNYNAPALGNYAFSTFMHELGHAMGLKHGQEASFAGALPAQYNSHEYSLMTYMSYVGSSGAFYSNAPDGGPQTFMMADIGALQTMYGANFTTQAGNSRYTFDTATGEAFINGVGQGDPNGNTIFRTVWDGGGTDTYDLGNFTTNLAIDLAPGAYSDFAVGALTWRADLGGSSGDLNQGYARGHLFNALLYQGDTRSLIENAIGGTGHDSIAGNLAGNALEGGAGNDSLLGLDGADSLIGGAGRDTLDGGTGNDLFDGGLGDDVVLGGDGSDTFRVGAAAAATGVAYDAASGSVTLTSAAGTDRLTGVEFLDFGGGDIRATSLFAGIPDTVAPSLLAVTPTDNSTSVAVGTNLSLQFSESMKAGLGAIQLYRADGTLARSILAADTSQVTIAGHTVTVNPAANLAFGASYYILVGADALTDLVGNAFAGILLPTAFNITTQAGLALTGTAAADTLTGAEGADTLNGGAGRDVMSGGLGDDLYLVDNSGDSVIETANGGYDTIQTSLASYSLASRGAVEALIATGGNGFYGQGNALDNRLTGTAGADTLDGGLGADTMNGGAGNDTYVVSSLLDLIIDSAGIDTVLASIRTTLAANLENLTLTGTSAIAGTGNAGKNVITGNSSANLLSGLDGNDVISGGAGADTIQGGRGADTLSGGSGADIFVFDTPFGGGIDRVTDFSVPDDTIQLSRTFFGGLALGTAPAGAFVIGASALDADDRIVYNSRTGALSYDADGIGGGAQQQFALLSTGLRLTAADFLVIA